MRVLLEQKCKIVSNKDPENHNVERSRIKSHPPLPNAQNPPKTAQTLEDSSKTSVLTEPLKKLKKKLKKKLNPRGSSAAQQQNMTAGARHKRGFRVSGSSPRQQLKPKVEGFRA